MTRIKEVTSYLESLAPLSTQESYDNCGLIVGDANAEVKGIIVSLDCTEAIVEEAKKKGCNLIVAHHPIVFKGLKKLNGSNYVERTVIAAIKADVAIYAIHTNFDHYIHGVNREIGTRLGLQNLRVLSPKKDLINKLVTYVPNEQFETVAEALFSAGAGHIGNYSECSFASQGIGTYKPNEQSNPFEGKAGQRSMVEERRLEVVVPVNLAGKLISVLKDTHPYEEVAYELYALLNENQYVGSGMIGEFETPMSEEDFLQKVKDTFHIPMIRHTQLLGREVKSIAFCGGAGSFLMRDAIRNKADFYLTGDMKYHEFFDAEDKIVLADIGHYESEQFTSNRLYDILTKNFPKFAVRLTEVNTNPINYY